MARKRKHKKGAKPEEPTIIEEDVKEEDSDEIELDFSFVKNIFKGKKDKPAKVKVQEAEEDDEESIEIDFSKITNFFKQKPEKEKTEEEKIEEEEEYLDVVEFDVTKIGHFLIENKKLMVYLLLLTIFGFSLWIRLFSTANPLLHAYDPYYHYRHAKMVVENDMQFPEWDGQSYYPQGRRFGWYGFPWMIALTYTLLNSIAPSLTVMASAKYLAGMFGALATIPAFYLGRKAAGEYAGLFAAFFVGTNLSILGRTVAGFSDSDGMMIFFSLLIFSLFVVAVDAFRTGKLTSKGVSAIILGGLVYALFSHSWVEARYLNHIIFPLPFALFGMNFLFHSGNLKERAKIAFSKSKNVLLVTLLFISVCAFFTYIPNGAGSAIKAPYGALNDVVRTYTNYARVTNLKAPTGGVAGTEGGKNVYISVAEMQAPDWGQYTSQLGFLIHLALALFVIGSSLVPYKVLKKEHHELFTYIISFTLLISAVAVFFSRHPISIFLARFLALVGLTGLVLALLKKSELVTRASNAFFEDERHINTMLFTLIWGGSLFLVSLMGVRFIMVLAPAICVAAAVFLDRVINLAKELSPKLSPIILILLMIFVTVKMAPPAYEIGKGVGPSMNDQWHDMLTWIKENTDEKTSTVTWWDPGHWVTAITQRRSGADGAHCNGCEIPISERIEDFGFAFATTNETQSVERLSKYRGDSKEMYLISSNDLLQKFVWLSYFGTDVKLNYLILHKPAGGEYQQDGATLHVYPIDDNVMIVVSVEGEQMIPYLYAGGSKQTIKELTFYRGNEMIKANYPEASIDGMVLVQPDMSLVVYMPAPLNDNIMTKSFFFRGAGLERFEKVFENQIIKLYKVKF